MYQFYVSSCTFSNNSVVAGVEVVVVAAEVDMTMGLATAVVTWREDLVVCLLVVPQLQQIMTKNGTEPWNH